MTQGDAASQIEHIVVLMLENRSFDHLLGTLAGVEGVVDGSGGVRGDLFNLVDPADPTSERLPPRIGARFAVPPDEVTGPYGGPSHSYPGATEQLFGVETVTVNGAVTTPYHGGAPATTPPSNSGFVKSFTTELSGAMGSAALAAAREAAAQGKGEDPLQEVMEVFTADQLPAIHTLAQEFCVCDHWFSELPGPTEPNRLFTHAGTATGLTYNPWALDIQDVPTIYDRIDAAGKDWAFYSFDLTDSTNYASLRDKPNANYKFAQFTTDAATGKLPFYSFLCPRYTDAPEGRANSQHAPADVRYGDALIADVYKAIRSSPLWETTLLIVTYDEHGGYFDGVTPPVVEAPDANLSPNAFMQGEAGKSSKNSYLLGPNYTFDFTRLGFRVPTLLISPWIKAGTIDSTPYRHTSILRFVHDLLGSPPLTTRDATATSFASDLSLAAPRTDCPESVPAPALPPEDPAAVMAAPPTQKQVDTARRLTVNLPGHPDTGRVTTRQFPTNASLNRYVTDRLQRAEWVRDGDYVKASFQIVGDASGAYRWRLLDSNGAELAAASTTYASPSAAADALERVRFLSQMLGDPTTAPANHHGRRQNVANTH
jgi:phospholipase C